MFGGGAPAAARLQCDAFREGGGHVCFLVNIWVLHLRRHHHQTLYVGEVYSKRSLSTWCGVSPNYCLCLRWVWLNTNDGTPTARQISTSTQARMVETDLQRI